MPDDFSGRGAGRLLFIEDDEEVRVGMRAYLAREGYEVLEAADGAQGESLFASSRPDLVILDLMLPKISGERVLLSIRDAGDVPVIIASAKGAGDAREQLDTKVALMSLGADDYLAKPYNPRELVARVSALLRRRDMARAGRDRRGLLRGELSFSFAGSEVTGAGGTEHLTDAEALLLSVLMKAAGEVLTREEISCRVTTKQGHPSPRAIDIQVRNLRRKLAAAAPGHEWVVTARGRGYYLDPDARSLPAS